MILGPEAIPALVVAAALGLIALVTRQWIVPAFIGLVWLSLPQHLYGGLPSPVEVGGLVMLAYVANRMARGIDFAPPLVGVAVLITLAAVCSSLVSPEGTSIPTKTLASLSFLFIGAIAVPGPAGVERVAIVLCAVGAFLGAGAMYSVLEHPTALFPLNDGVEGAEAARAAGPFGEANFFALSLAVIVPFAAYLMVRGGPLRVLGTVSLAALVGGVLATGSRGGLIALVAGLLATWMALSVHRWRALLVTLAVGIALTPLFAAQLESSGERTVSGRATENLVALAMFADHPLTGVGANAYPVLYRDYTREIGNDPRSMREAHSLPLQIAAEQGLAGLLAWLAAIVIVVRYAIQRNLWELPLGRALLFALLTYAIGSLFLHGSQIRLLFVLIGMVFAMGAGAAVSAASGSARKAVA